MVSFKKEVLLSILKWCKSAGCSRQPELPITMHSLHKLLIDTLLSFHINFYALQHLADQDFPIGRGRGGAPKYHLANFHRKLHENEEI